MLYKQVFFTGFSCVGPGARLVVESQGGGGGRLLCRSPRVKYLGCTSNGHLFLSTFCAGGGNVTFGVFVVPPSLMGRVGCVGHYQNMTRHVPFVVLCTLGAK